MTGVVKAVLQGGPFDGQVVRYSDRRLSRMEMELGDRNSPAASAPELAATLGAGGRMVAVYVKRHGRWVYDETADGKEGA